MRLAQIENGKVKNIILGTLTQFPDYKNVTTVQCGIGWTANNDGTYTSDYVAPEVDPVVSITNVVFSGAGYDETQEDGRVDLSTDSNITLSFDVTLPDTTKLTIPVINKNTGQMKVIRARVTGNAVSKTIKFKESGFWYINSKIINDMGRIGVQFAIDDILMLVLDD